jgi:rubrerythrin
MHRESILRFSPEKGFGETFWITCPVCWNAMKLTVWELAPNEEDCPACRRKERLMAS